MTGPEMSNPALTWSGTVTVSCDTATVSASRKRLIKKMQVLLAIEVHEFVLYDERVNYIMRCFKPG